MGAPGHSPQDCVSRHHQCCERRIAQTTRRRPIRIEFCAADILQLFDDWRRAVGVAPPEAASAATRKPSLASHIERSSPGSSRSEGLKESHRCRKAR